MEIELKLRHELAAQDPGPGFTAGVMTRVKGHWRSRSRVILFSAILVAGAAAAALLSVHLAERPSEPVLTTVTTLTPEAVDADMAVLRMQDDVYQSSLAASAGLQASSVLASAAFPSNLFIVDVSALRHQSEDPASIEVAESFYRAFTLELRKIPEVVVVEPGAAAQYRITLTSRPAPNTPAAYIEGYNRVVLGSLKPGSSRWQVQVAVESPQLEKGIYLTDATGFFPADCSISPKALEAQMPDNMVCPGPSDIAWSTVQTVRRRVFRGATRPSTMTAAFDAEMLESSTRQEASLQKQALLLKGRDNWQLADISALADVASAEKDPVRRLGAWNALRGVRNPAAVPLIISALRTDPDARVRLGALQLLLQDHSADPALTAAVEYVALNDPQEAMRQLAQRFLGGGTQWRNSVSASLRDTSLPDYLRLEQFLFISRSLELTAALSTLVDANAAQALGDLLPRMSVDPSQAAEAARILKRFAGSDFLRMKLMVNASRGPDPAAQAAALSMVKTLFDDNPGLRTAMEKNPAPHPDMQSLLGKLRAIEAGQLPALPQPR